MGLMPCSAQTSILSDTTLHREVIWTILAMQATTRCHCSFQVYTVGVLVCSRQQDVNVKDHK